MAVLDSIEYEQTYATRILTAGILGFAIGAQGANSLGSTWFQPKMDAEIMDAYDTRQAQKFYTVSGYTSNWLSENHTNYPSK